MDECAADTDGCQQICTNTIGSFLCGCNTGFTLSVDGRTCSGKSLIFIKNARKLLIFGRISLC